MPKTYTIDTEIRLPLPPAEVFPFFGDAGNLEAITPPWLRFAIVTPQPIEMRVGTLIEYRLRLHGIPIRWLTRITAWDPPHRFVDEQIRGPYRLWRHEHTFTAVERDTLVRDHVDYTPRGGGIVHRYFVRPDLDRIFAYRNERIAAAFAKRTAAKTEAPAT